MVGAGHPARPAAAYILDAEGAVKLAVLANAEGPLSCTPPAELIALAEQGQVPLTMPTKTPGLEDDSIPYRSCPCADARCPARRVGAIAKLRNYPGSYLYVARGVDARGGAPPARHAEGASPPTTS